MKKDTNVQYVIWGIPLAKFYGAITIIALIVVLILTLPFP